MPKGHYGDYLRSLRSQHDVTQLELSEELGVSISTIFRIENGSKKPSYAQYQCIMQTLGEYSGDYATVFMSKNDIVQYSLLSKLRCAIRDGRMDEAKELLEEAAINNKKTENELRQFCIYAKVMLNNDITNEAAIEQLMDALAIRKKPLPLPNVANIMLRYNDIIILGELANRHAQNGNIDFAIDLLRAIKNSMDRFIFDEREKSVTYPILLFNLSVYLGIKEQYDDVLELCRAATRMALQYNNLKILPFLLYNIASAISMKGDKEGCIRYLYQAYFTAQGMENYQVAEMIKDDAEKNFGIIIGLSS